MNNIEEDKNMQDKQYNEIKDGFMGKEFTQLTRLQRETLLEHYHRCSQFWMHWTTTIWSLPTVASAINIGVYSLVFGTAVSAGGRIIALGVLALLNLILTLGLWKHQNMQKKFGDRIKGIEKYASIKVLKLGQQWSGSTAYLLAMIFLTLTSAVFYVVHLISKFPSLVRAIPLSIPAIGFLVILFYVFVNQIRRAD